MVPNTPLDRRRFLRLGAGAAAAAATGAAVGPLMGRSVWAAAPGTAGVPVSPADHPGAPPAEPPPGVYRFAVGEMEVTVVNDGYFYLPAEVYGADVEEEARNRYFTSRHLPTDAIRGQLCPTVIDTGSKRILVDAGMGPPPEFAPDTGRLERALPAVGLAPEEIDLVILTHAHGDHFGGLFDEAGAVRFPNADVVISRPELEFWTAPDAPSRVGDWADLFGGPDAFVEISAGVLRALDDRLRVVEPGAEIETGIHGIHSPGHTPGHLAVLVESEGEQLLLVGDAIVGVHSGFEHPRWQFQFDLDGEEGVRSRTRLLDRAATDGLLMAGYHFPFPGVGRVARDGRAYRWLPAVRS